MENLLSMPLRPSEVLIGKIIPYIIVGYIQVGIILLLIGVFPTWPHSVNLGCFPPQRRPGVC